MSIKKVLVVVVIFLGLLALSHQTYMKDQQDTKEVEVEAEVALEHGNITYVYDAVSRASVWIHEPTGHIFVIKED